MLACVVRRGWTGLLAVLPAPVIRHLDAWAQAQAARRADRRRRALRQARAR